jgi:hypothetical protein
VFHLVLEVVIVGAVIIAVRNLLALPIAWLLSAFNVEHAREMSRAVVSMVGKLILLVVTSTVFALAWKSGLLGAFAGTLGDAARGFGRIAYMFIVASWRYVLT